jgi:hypothetical protein
MDIAGSAIPLVHDISSSEVTFLQPVVLFHISENAVHLHVKLIEPEAWDNEISLPVL